MIAKIGFGGGCHWCTEAVFSAIHGVKKVDQGWISSVSPNDAFSEGVIVYYDPGIVSLKALIQVHLNTHASTSSHKMRQKYRSAVYYFQEKENHISQKLLNEFSVIDNRAYITQILPFANFKKNEEQFIHYFEKNKNAPFCQTYIIPKINYLEEKFPDLISN